MPESFAVTSDLARSWHQQILLPPVILKMSFPGHLAVLALKRPHRPGEYTGDHLLCLESQPAVAPGIDAKLAYLVESRLPEQGSSLSQDVAKIAGYWLGELRH
jgi:hypothetical protein